MSEACCKHAHVPYIMGERAIKKDFLVENFGDTATFEHRIEANPYNTPEKKLRDINVTYVIKDKVEIKLCTCECHVQGMGLYVLH
jgi:hypothetical protein